MARLSLVALIYFVLTGCSRSSDSADELIHRFMATNQVHGMFVAVVKGDSVLHQNSFGISNGKTGAPILSTTCMELGSISKAFTAEVIYQLHNENLLSIEEPITNYLTGSPASWSNIKIRHLLTHTSGIQNYLLDQRFRAREYFTGSTDPVSTHFFSTVSIDSMVTMFYSLPVEFLPGTSWAYSNTGYYLLGKIAEVATGRKFFDLVAERVTVPLQMNRTMANELALKQGCLDPSYFHTDTGFAMVHALMSNYAFSAGAWATTGEDMIKYLKAIHRNLLPSGRAGFQRGSLADNQLPFAYEGGRFYSTYQGKRIMAHNGGTAGFSSSWIHVVDEGISIIVLMNRQDYAAIEPLAWDILATFETSLQYPAKPLEGNDEETYVQKLVDIVNAVKANGQYPDGMSRPLQTFMNSENGKGIWRWYFERGFPEAARCVDKEVIGKTNAYRFRMPLSDTVEYRVTMIVNEKKEITQIRWW